MRTPLIGLAAVVFIGLAGTAQAAERHMFIIGNDSKGYGVDRCLAGGEKCGKAAANAYCRTQKFAQASYYRKVERSEITGSVPKSATSGCRGGKCENYVAIVCTR
jgi:hypothetical protein